MQVYGQIGAESVPGGGEPDSDDHVARYAAAFVQIVDHFRDRVRVFETFNEPNNWRDAAPSARRCRRGDGLVGSGGGEGETGFTFAGTAPAAVSQSAAPTLPALPTCHSSSALS